MSRDGHWIVSFGKFRRVGQRTVRVWSSAFTRPFFPKRCGRAAHGEAAVKAELQTRRSEFRWSAPPACLVAGTDGRSQALSIFGNRRRNAGCRWTTRPIEDALVRTTQPTEDALVPATTAPTWRGLLE